MLIAQFLMYSSSCRLSDTICELGGADELANYGEYSGAPSESQTFQYAKTILKLMTEGQPFPNGIFPVCLFLVYIVYSSTMCSEVFKY